MDPLRGKERSKKLTWKRETETKVTWYMSMLSCLNRDKLAWLRLEDKNGKTENKDILQLKTK